MTEKVPLEAMLRRASRMAENMFGGGIAGRQGLP
jgi:hypothetical protein